jgi:hypothetical protein
MGRITIASYKPKPGKDADLATLVRNHLPILQTQNLVTERKPIVMKATDGTIVEIFEWKSPEAISAAHTNPEVQKMWQAFNEVCEYLPPVSIKEFHNLFAEFEPIN